MNSRPAMPPIATPLLALYSGALVALLAVASPWWLRGLRPGGKYREGVRERLGIIPRDRLLLQNASPFSRGAIWVHAVSVGEVLAVAPLVLALREARPDTRTYVSTTTRTGQALARARFGTASVFYFPADFAFAVRAWLRALHPALIILVESEFWPRFLYEASRARVPVAVVNARISPRSWPRYQGMRRLWRPLLASLRLVLAQTTEDALRLQALGAADAQAAGNLKYDLKAPAAKGLLAALQAVLPRQAQVLVCGSTLPGEEQLLLRTLPQSPILLLAPRHPERFSEVAALLASSGRSWLRVSDWRTAPQAIMAGTVLLLDSVGELASLYALATVAIVGGGFLHKGGHNPVEPAFLGKPVVVGPHYENFAEIVATLSARKALRIAGTAQLGVTVSALLEHPGDAAAMGERAGAVCRESAGATGRALKALLALVPQ